MSRIRGAIRILSPMLTGLALVVVPSRAQTGSAEPGVPVLRIATWTSYVAIDPTTDPNLPTVDRSPVLQEFQRRYGCVLHYAEFEDEPGITRYVRTHRGQVDLVCLPPEELRVLWAEGLIETLPATSVPRLAEVMPRLRNIVQTSDWIYMVPYMSGMTGILYARDRVPTVDSWAQLFRPAPGIRVSLLDSPSTVYLHAHLMLGHDVLGVTDAQVTQVSHTLEDLFDSGQMVMVETDIEKVTHALLGGRLDLAMMYSGEAITATQEHPELAFVLPQEGFDHYIDCWAILRESSQSDLALKFIDYMLEPKVQCENSRAMNYQVVTTPAMILQREAEEIGAATLSGYLSGDELERSVSTFETEWSRQGDAWRDLTTRSARRR